MATLRIYRAPSGQWSGRLIDDDGEELGGVAGCASPDEVEEAVADTGLYPDEVVIES
jgi:hypothetical protein